VGKLAGGLSQIFKRIVHFLIQVPILAQVYINMSRTFADIGPLEILSSFPPYWISKWPHLKNTFSIISRSNAAIDLNSGVYMCKIGACITKCTILEYLGNTLKRMILLMNVKCLLMS